MANLDIPSGLKPVGKIRLVIPRIAGAAIRPGEPVKLADDGKIDPAAAGDAILGVAIGLALVDGDEIMVSEHPDQEYSVQCDGSEVNAQTFVGMNGDILATAANATYNAARTELDSSTVQATSASQLKILRLDPEVNNAFGANARVIVKIQELQTAAI